MRTTLCIAAVAVVSALFLYGLNASLDSPIAPRPRILLMSNVAGSDWDRTLAGAQAAARDLGVDLEIKTIPANTADSLTTVAQRVDAAAYSGVALSLDDPESHRALVNDFADRTKVITIGNDFDSDARRTR